MNEKLERARKLEAEAKAIRRAEMMFWSNVIDRADEVKERLGLTAWDEICRAYEIFEENKNDLFAYLISKKQIEYYRKQQRNKQQGLNEHEKRLVSQEGETAEEGESIAP